MKRALSFLFSLMLMINLISGIIPKAAATNWSAQYLQNLVDRNVMQGDKYGNLYPDNLITRAEFAALLNRSFGFTQKGTKTFKDVAATTWYAADINIASNQGYMQGNAGGANPSGYLTREEAATMLCRSLKIPLIEGESFQLQDERDFSNWSRGYINAAVNKRFVNGYPDGSFKPTNNITRGEAAKMISEVAGEIVSSTVNRAGRTVYGNLTISSSAVTLSNVTVQGDLFITEGVGLGYVDLKNVKVLGEVIISGAGESNVGQSSITLTDCTISNLVVDVAKRKILTLKTDGTTTVENTMIKSTTYLEELNTYYRGFDKVNVDAPSGTTLNLKGNFGDVRLITPDSTLNLYKGQVDGITVDEAAQKSKLFLEKDTLARALYFDTGATVTGTGKIESALINNDGTTIAQVPENIYIRPGVTATINGKKMTSLDAEIEALTPDFSYQYPKADLIQPTSFTEYYKTNKPGKVYYAIYPSGWSTPTSDQLMAKSGAPKDALKYGNVSTLPDKEVTVPISGLKSGTQYVLYSLFVDFRGKMSDTERTYVQTIDNTVPVLLSGYPKLSSVDRDKAVFSLAPNKNTSYYWVVLPKQSVAPTVDQLYQQSVSGTSSKGVTHGGIMNTTTDINTFSGGTLGESVNYTFYVILRDSSGNMSKTPYKLDFITTDLTAPSFYPEDTATEINYPKVGVVTTTSIPFDFMVNESCTLYWVAVKTGTNVLPLGADGKPDFTIQKSKDIVKSGTGATKFGKVAAAAPKTKYTVNVSSLEQQMPYDVYFMLEDKLGNQSNIKLVSSKTKDTGAPTASLSSTQEIGGQFGVDSPISITFSEIVCSSQTDASGNPLELSKLFATNHSELDNYIRLMDTTKVPNTPVSIDWTTVSVKDVDAKTVITFDPKFVLPGPISLSNNNAYRFDLGYKSGYVIKDTSKNEMRSNTALPFKTVPPLTYFAEIKNISSNYHSAFLITPTAQQTGEYMNFDIMLRSDHEIKFEIFKSTDGNFDPASGTACTLQANFSKPLSTYLSQPTYANLQPTYYAIKLTEIDSKAINADGSSPVTVNVNLLMNAVIGTTNKLAGLQGPAASFDTRLKEAIARGDVSSVTAPNDPFSLRIGLVDSIPPKCEGTPTFTPFDTQVVMSIKTDKECDVYYLAIPSNENPPLSLSESSIRNAKSIPARGIAAGSFHVPAVSGVATEYTINGLLPPVTTYRLYSFLQGAAPTTTLLDTASFDTKLVPAPQKFAEPYYDPGADSVTVHTTWNSDCMVFYVVYPEGTVFAGGNPTYAQILNPTNGTELIASGSFKATKEKNESTIITGLKSPSRYNFYAVAQKYIGSGDPPTLVGSPSNVLSVPSMIPLDAEPPRIVAGSPTSVITSQEGLLYTGLVTLEFSEPLYYLESNDLSPKPLTQADFVSKYSGTYSNTTPSTPIVVSNSTEDPGIRSITISFTKIPSGTTILFAKDICDRALNKAGSLSIQFKEDPADPTKMIWTAKFSP